MYVTTIAALGKEDTHYVTTEEGIASEGELPAPKDAAETADPMRDIRSMIIIED